MSAASSRSSTTRPFQRLASPKLTCSSPDCSRVRPPGTGSTTGSPAGSPSEPVSVRSRSSPSAPVSRSPSSRSAAPSTASVEMRRPPPALLTPSTRTVLSPAKKPRKSGGTSGAISPLKSTSNPRPASLERSATRPPATRVPSASSAKRDVDVVDRPRALGGQVDRRLALDPQQRRDQPALRLVQVEVDVELPRGVREAGPERQLAPGPVEAPHRDVALQHAPRQVQRPADRDPRGAAEHRLVEAHVGERQLGEVDRHRQLRQRERRRLGAGQRRPGRRRRLRPAHPGDPLGAQPVDVHPAAQQRQPAPVELDVVDLEPAPGRVGDADLGDPRPRRQRAGHAVQPDLPRRRRQPALQQVHQEAVAALGLGRVLRHRADRHEREQAEDCREPSQNACPMPM